MMKIGLWLFILLNLAARGVIALLETVGTPEYLDALGDFIHHPSLDPAESSSTMFFSWDAEGCWST